MFIPQDGCTGILSEVISTPAEEVINYHLDLYLQRAEAGQGRNTKRRYF